MNNPGQGDVLIYAIRSTDRWWSHVGNGMGFDRSFVVSDIKGKGDFPLAEDFNRLFSIFYKAEDRKAPLLPEKILTEIIRRCRVLRSLSPKVARAMVLGMADALDSVLESVCPVAVVAFPIDRYVSDVLYHLARFRGVPFFELTVSPFPGMAMLMNRGRLIRRHEVVDNVEVEGRVHELISPFFAPSYVRGNTSFGFLRFLRVFTYFKLRSTVFKAVSILKGDPRNLHYLDAQSSLPHKVSFSDRKVLRLIDYAWKEKVQAFDPEKRIFFGLTVFPEASIDYWIAELDLINYEDILVSAAESFSQAGYIVVVKDHPQQFGFRRADFIERLLKIENLVFVPYSVSGNELLSLCNVSFSFTGTLGLQAAMLGKTSITVENYYSTEGDFIYFRSKDDIQKLPLSLPKHISQVELEARSKRIVSNLLKGSFEFDFFSFLTFNAKHPSDASMTLGLALGKELKRHL